MLTEEEGTLLLEIQTNNRIVDWRSCYSTALYSLIFPTGCLLGCVTLWGHERRSAKRWTETLKSGGKLKEQIHAVQILQFQSEWNHSLRVLLQYVTAFLKLRMLSLTVVSYKFHDQLNWYSILTLGSSFLIMQTWGDQPHSVNYY